MRTLFILAGLLSSGVALLHIVIIFLGGPGYRYFGAGEEFAEMAEAGSWMPPMATVAITIAFVLCALYAFSAAGLLRPLRLVRLIMLFIGLVYLARGLAIFPQAAQVARGALELRWLLFSAVAFVGGWLHLIPTIARWRALEPKH